MSKQTIIICRHGETDGNNSKNKILGRSKDSLNAAGIMQAEALGKKIKGLNVQSILTSKTRRALQTAKIISKITGIPVKTDSRLDEYNFGIFTGKVMDRKEIYKGIKNKNKIFTYRLPGGESDKDVVKRIKSFMDEIVREKINTVVCTHSFPAFVLINLLSGHKVNDFVDLPFKGMQYDQLIVIKKHS